MCGGGGGGGAGGEGGGGVVGYQCLLATSDFRLSENKR